VSSSGAVGGGQISVPGVTLIDFTGVEYVNVDGNTPTLTETDTVTFAGTNAPIRSTSTWPRPGPIAIRS
jgi:hypothetical protein